MALSTNDVLALAPDASSAAAGRKLADARHWQSMGKSDDALWGECRGSALYQTRVALADMATKCSCPSRKFPCKHALGLMLIDAGGGVSPGPAPDWVKDWLSKRAERAEKKATSAAAPPKETDEKARESRIDRRDAKVKDGLAVFLRRIEDLVQSGIAGIEAQSSDWFGQTASRLVDAQCPGLASRVRRLPALAASGPERPQRLLAELGRLHLVASAYLRIDELPDLAGDLSAIIGWTWTEEELRAHGDLLRDRFTVFAQWTDDDERVRVQGSWVYGKRSRRTALLLGFAVGSGAFPEPTIPATEWDGEIAFYPSAYPLRARILDRTGAPQPLLTWPDGLPTDVDPMLLAAADAWSKQPLIERFGCVLRGVRESIDGRGRTCVTDQNGRSLPLSPRQDHLLAAVTGGRPFDLSGEWNGATFSPLGAVIDGRHHVLGGRA
jgi:hypothetical protein